jgi:crotonobetainyl-CoA:carnitine CoA-transferase CaiB-like acyl-CoA transferase
VLASTPLIEVHRSAGARPRPWGDHQTAPLSGVRVLDLTRVIAGPIGTRDLAFAGADVLRVDSPRLPELEAQHLDTGAGKRSTRLDLDRAADRRVFDSLLTSADIVVTGYRPGGLDRRGLSPEALWERRPGIVVGSVSAWGSQGPWGDRRGFDSIVQAVSGIALIESTDGSTPGALPAQALDHSAGHLLAAGLAHCLTQQRQEGGSWSTSIALARIAHSLIGAPRSDVAPAAPPPEATLQHGTTAAGDLVCPLPPLTFPGAPSEYPELATPWGIDRPRWR